MKVLSFVLLLMAALWLPAQAQTNSTSTANREEEVFTVVEQHPEFPGGMNKLANYLRKNLRYPEAARNAKLEGRVLVSFIVTAGGHIEDVYPLKSPGMGTAEEAVRLVQNMPNWIPGKQSGRPVNVRYNLVVNFIL